MRQHCLSREQWPQPAEACFNDASSQVWNTAALPRCLKLCGSSRSSWNREAITVCPDSWAAAQPKIERHRNQALGSSVSRRLADIFSSFTQPPSCKVQPRDGKGVRCGGWNKWACASTCKALLPAVNVDLGCSNGQLLFRFNCLTITQTLHLCHRPSANSSKTGRAKFSLSARPSSSHPPDIPAKRQAAFPKAKQS